MEENKVMRVFLDGNVVFSGLYSSQGPSGLIVQRQVEGSLAAIISRQVLHEVVRTVTERLPRALPALKTFLESAPPEICADARPAEAARWIEFLHAEEAAILAAAVGARPDYFDNRRSSLSRQPCNRQEGQALHRLPGPLHRYLRVTRHRNPELGCYLLQPTTICCAF